MFTSTTPSIYTNTSHIYIHVHTTVHTDISMHRYTQFIQMNKFKQHTHTYRTNTTHIVQTHNTHMYCTNTQHTHTVQTHNKHITNI